MVYKDKVLGLMEALDGKIKVVENAINGSIMLSHGEILVIISDIKRVSEQVTSLIDIER